MDQVGHKALLLPTALLTEIESAAAAEERPALELLRDAVEMYLRDRPLTPAEAATRMLARRKFHPLPSGETIRGMTIHGRE